MSRKQKKTLWRILAAAGLFVLAIVADALWIPEGSLWALPVYLIPYVTIGWPVLFKAGRNIAHGQVFDENFLMAVASIGAFAIGEYKEAVAVMLFYQVGELFEQYAVGRTRQNIAELMDIRPDEASVERDGEVVVVDPDEVGVGEVIVVRPGERVPIDGVVLEGESTLDTAALTGESVPRTVRAGESVISGCINLSGLLRVRTEKAFGESTVSKILELVENSGERKARRENFITRFARWYTPAVCLGAVLLAVIPSLITGHWAEWIHRALIFLVVSCPCALVISIPLGFFGGIGGASRQGILIKGSNYLEALAQVDTVVFDKTGTLTEGSFKVTAVYPEAGVDAGELLERAALAESYSGHPIARSLLEAWGAEAAPDRAEEVREISGHGVTARVDGRRVAVGNARLMAQEGVEPRAPKEAGTHVHVAVDGAYAGCIVIADAVKPDAAGAIRQLRDAGVRRLVMLTGDSRVIGEAVAESLGLDEVHSELLPADKVAQVERLIGAQGGADVARRGGLLAFVGDGLNDAPVLSRADVGIAMGALGSDAAIEAADVVLMKDKPSDIATALRIARKTLRIVHENIAFALGVKALVLVLGALGLANMWAAVFADVGVSVIAILNAMRMLRAK